MSASATSPELARSTTRREEEAAHLLALYARDPARVMATVESQLGVLAGRAQTLLSLTGLTITVTGFSGASIAHTSTTAAVLIVSGLVLVLLGAAQCIGGILAVRWTTSLVPCSLEAALLYALARRDEKTRAYMRALYLVVAGLSAYVISVSLLLLSAPPPAATPTAPPASSGR